MKPASSLPLISLISVVYNDKDNLESTIRSVLAQQTDNFEYIIVDGGSTDGTLSVISRYESDIDHVISEPDKGIYDAMNKGISVARGKYLNFLNAGDSYFDSSCLQKVEQALVKDKPEILYGKAAYLAGTPEESYSYVVGEQVEGKELFSSIPICHQVMFYQRSLFQEFGLYSQELRIVADYEWLIRYYKERKNLAGMSFFDEVLVKYPMTGLSFLNLGEVGKERLKVAKQHFSPKYILVNYWILIFMKTKSIVIPILEKLKILQLYRKMRYLNA